MKLNTKSGYPIENGLWNSEHQEEKCGIYESPIPTRHGSWIPQSKSSTLLFWIDNGEELYGKLSKRWKDFPMLYSKLFLREQMISPRVFGQHNNAMNFLHLCIQWPSI